MKRFWGRIFAACYDRLMASAERAGLGRQRERLLGQTSGRVLEIGGGTGANLPFYPRDVAELVITEPAEPMARQLERKLDGEARPIRVVSAPAEALPFDDASFDVAVSTLVLCTVDDPAQALRELHRVLKPRGRLLFLEHVRSPDARIARWQDRLHGIWCWFGAGCHCNRPTLDTLLAAGFSVTALEHAELPKAPSIVRPMIVGAAVRA
ncbi:MAG TPA: class I SAM-dependent methyltransferase [Gemmatimonadaceae bacterium]|nr:class I SAM-dependent methyltransferase [Gemmatimonadaceae bacterium]